MQLISNSVGENGTNGRSDSALVQAILLKINGRADGATQGRPYLTSYDGQTGNLTKAAIRNFQADHVLRDVTGARVDTVANYTAGLVEPGDATWLKLLELVDPAFADMRVLATSRIVYVAATAAELQTKIAAAAQLTFTQAFRVRVNACINQMHTQHGIAVGVCPQGDRRDFQNQYDLLNSGRNVTNAGPGESNHNFGMAVDLGFRGLSWLRSNGDIQANETDWLHRLDATHAGQSSLFWQTLRAVGTSAQVGAFRGPAGDWPHLQNWNDAGVSMTARLPVHLTNSSDNGMQWGRVRGSYTSDLGFGGPQFNVGTSSQIWSSNATVTTAMIDQGRAAQYAATPANQRGPAPARATQADVTAMRAELRRQFELADANWQNWTPN